MFLLLFDDNVLIAGWIDAGMLSINILFRSNSLYTTPLFNDLSDSVLQNLDANNFAGSVQRVNLITIFEILSSAAYVVKNIRQTVCLDTIQEQKSHLQKTSYQAASEKPQRHSFQPP